MKSQVTFSLSELEFLAEHVPDEHIRLLLKKNCRQRLASGRVDQVIPVELEVHEIKTLLNELGGLFCEIGLGEHDEPNPVGLMIEAIVDKVNRLRWPIEVAAEHSR